MDAPSTRTKPASSARVTSSTTPTARRSPPRAPDAPQRWTLSATLQRSRTRRSPPSVPRHGRLPDHASDPMSGVHRIGGAQPSGDVIRTTRRQRQRPVGEIAPPTSRRGLMTALVANGNVPGLGRPAGETGGAVGAWLRMGAAGPPGPIGGPTGCSGPVAACAPASAPRGGWAVGHCLALSLYRRPAGVR